MANIERKDFSYVIPINKPIICSDYNLLHQRICQSLYGQSLSASENHFFLRFQDEGVDNEFEYEIKNNGNALLFNGSLGFNGQSKKNKEVVSNIFFGVVLISGIIAYLLHSFLIGIAAFIAIAIFLDHEANLGWSKMEDRVKKAINDAVFKL